MSKTMIALVATAVMVGGCRTIIEPGQELPADLSRHDADELLRTRMAENPAVTQAQVQAEAIAHAQAQREFQEARARVQAAQEASTAPDSAGAAGADEPAAAAKKAKAAPK